MSDGSDDCGWVIDECFIGERGQLECLQHRPAFSLDALKESQSDQQGFR